MIEQFNGLERKKTFEFLQAGKNRNDLTPAELKAAVLNSLWLIAEEFSELLDALGDKIDPAFRQQLSLVVFNSEHDNSKVNPIEIVDAVCDIKVVLANFEYFLDIEDVCELNMVLVEDNNLTKVNVDQDCADKTIAEYKERGMTNLIKKITSLYPFSVGYTVLNKNGKILKPSGYKPVELVVSDETVKHIGLILDVD